MAAGESVFVGLARERIPEKAATFNEVSAQVAADYRNAEATRLATEAAAKAEGIARRDRGRRCPPEGVQ